jgi:P-type Na+/K+ transporter
MDSLRSLASPNAQVIRDAKSVTVPSPQVVVGDLVEVKTGGFFASLSPSPSSNADCRLAKGDVVPADLRLVEAMNFETDEALLTGESLPVAKDVGASWDSKTGDFDPRDVGVGGEL